MGDPKGAFQFGNPGELQFGEPSGSRESLLMGPLIYCNLLKTST